MTRDRKEQEANTGRSDSAASAAPGQTPGAQDDELEAEQESAAAMDSDVPQPPGANETTEGQPS